MKIVVGNRLLRNWLWDIEHSASIVQWRVANFELPLFLRAFGVNVIRLRSLGELILPIRSDSLQVSESTEQKASSDQSLQAEIRASFDVWNQNIVK